MAKFPGSAFRFTKGEPQVYRSSAIAERSCCGKCGSPLILRYLTHPVSGPDMFWVQVGTLDHPEVMPIDFHNGVETQLPWVHFDDDLPRYRCDESADLVAAFAAAGEGKD